MHLPFVLALLLSGSAAAKADGGPAVPDELLIRSDDRFEVAVKGVTGAHIDVRQEACVGSHCSFTTATREGVFVLMDILVRDGEEKGKKLVELKLVKFSADGRAEVVLEQA